jgi:preprotein translocase subunit SecA
MVILRTADELWRDHLLAIDRLRQGIGLRGYGQRNPVLEYKRDAFNMYQLMAAMRDARALTQLLRAQLQIPQAVRTPQVLQLPAPQPEPTDAAPAAIPVDDAPAVELAPPIARPAPGDEARAFAAQYGMKRNDPCPCGSGQKFKKCCGAEKGDEAAT